MPSRDANTGEPEYGYRPPASVKEADRKECAADSEAVAQGAALSASRGNPGPLLLFGPVGLVVAAGYMTMLLRHERKVAYEKSMRTCLTDKGYSLP